MLAEEFLNLPGKELLFITFSMLIFQVPFTPEHVSRIYDQIIAMTLQTTTKTLQATLLQCSDARIQCWNSRREYLCPQARNFLPVKLHLCYQLTHEVQSVLTSLDSQWLGEIIPSQVCPRISQPHSRWRFLVFLQKGGMIQKQIHLITILPSQKWAHSSGSPSGGPCSQKDRVGPVSTPVFLPRAPLWTCSPQCNTGPVVVRYSCWPE